MHSFQYWQFTVSLETRRIMELLKH
jgi:hypothetical protein